MNMMLYNLLVYNLLLTCSKLIRMFLLIFVWNHLLEFLNQLRGIFILVKAIQYALILIFIMFELMISFQT